MEKPVWSTRGMLPTSKKLSSKLDSDNKGRRMSQSRRTHLRSTCGTTSRARNKFKQNSLITQEVTNQQYSNNERGRFNEFNDCENNSLCFNCNFNDNQVKRTNKFKSVISDCKKSHRNGSFNYLWQSVIFILFSIFCISAANECALGLKTPGRTWPPGDIVLSEGEPLRILCVLNKTFIDIEYPGKNASDLVFVGKKHRIIGPEFVQIINETAIEMYIDAPPPSKDMYYCKLRLDGESENEFVPVCLNNVVIGSKPKEPENFTCISHNWENMLCTWDPVPNYVKTRFTIAFKFPGRAGGRRIYPCPKPKEGEKQLKNRCYWDKTTDPIYRQPYEYYTFILNAENVLGNLTTIYKFHHFANVIPTKPGNLTVVNKTTESVLLYWTVPLPMESFPPGLYHRIAYQHQWNSRKTWQVINITDHIHVYKRYYNLTGLEFANTLYDVRVFMKSAVAIGEDKWSKFSDITFRTPPKLPGLPPRTDVGSFEISDNSVNRDVYIYWQSIPTFLENGDNFKYQVVHVQENGKTSYIEPNETTRAYAKFKGISFNSYRFELITTNAVGANPEKAVVFVPSRSEILREPLAFTKIAFDDGLYELSWKPPLINTAITNYTIFWCDNERDRPYQCTGYLQWVHVSPETTIYNMTVPDPHKVYQFAISANTNYSSSGMVWASCTVIHNKVVGKMKSVWINRIGSDWIEVGWKLECSDRIGIVEGFKIYYCPIITPYNLNCKGPKLNTTIKAEPHTIHGTLRDLKPYTTYMISVAVLTKSGEGLHSDALYNTTYEAAPTPPRNITIKNVTNSTMFVSWDPPSAMNGVLRYYEVHYTGNIQKVEEATHVQLKNLLAYKNYSIHVQACTVSCSPPSEIIYKQTGIGVPGKINRVPIVRFINSSQVSVVWSKPINSGGKLDYYQISSRNGDIKNSTKIETSIPIPDCNTEGRNRMHTFSVRAVNIINGQHLYGPWSDPGEGNCYSGGPTSSVLVSIWIIGCIGAIAFIFCMIYTTKRMWIKCKVMQDVEVKLPPGLAGEKLLQKVVEQHIRQSSADSSGCSSGHESVTSSLTSDSRVSTDSGTEIDPVVSPKLLEPSNTWESSSLRQRNVGSVRANEVADSGRWESYVKVIKPGDEDNSSLARSTPNLTDSSGFMMPQQTWSSTGYISMPSSEELSSNPSPVPKENTGGYSVVGVLPKGSKADDFDGKKSAPYVSFASLEPIRDKQKIEGINVLDNLTKYIDPTIVKGESPSYVQSGLMDSDKSEGLMGLPNFGIGRPQGSTSEGIKPYVAVGSLGDGKMKNIENKEVLSKGGGDASGKPYVLASSVFHMLQKKEYDGGGEVVEEKGDESMGYGLFWEPEESKLERRDEAVEAVKSSGYVTVADVQKAEHLGKGMRKVEGGKTDEQYSKVSVAPRNVQ